MAEKPVGNRSSEGVVAIRHPRTDFPQMGWLSKATLTFYEPNDGFGWWSETQSFRPNENPLGYRTRQRSPRVFYQTEPQQGWLNKPVNLNLYEANTGFGWFSETHSFRPNERTIGSGAWRGPRHAFYQTKPSEVYDPSVLARLHTSWSIPSERTRAHAARDLDRWDQDDANFDVITFTTFDPAQQEWHIETVKTRTRKWWSSDPQPFDWLYQNVLVDPSVFLWTMPDVRTRARNAAIPRGSEPQDTSWVYQNLPLVFDPATQTWMADTTSTRTRKWWSSDPHPQFDWLYQNVLVDPSLYSWSIDSQWKPNRRPWSSDPHPQFDWLFQNVLFDPLLYRGGHPADRMAQTRLRKEWQTFRSDPDLAWIVVTLSIAFDPATQRWTLDWPRMGLRKTWSHIPMPDAWLVPSVIFDAQFFPATNLDSSREWGKALGRWQPDVDNAWLYYSATNHVWTITGQTLTCAGAVLASCTVMLFRTSDNVMIGTTTSDGTGAYSFVVPDGVTAYFLVAYHPNAPDTAGTTLNTIVGS